MTRSLPRLVRFDVAKELVLTARMLDAEEAVELGLATRVDDDPLAAARELAAEIAGRLPDATRRGKALLERAWSLPAAESLALEEELQRELLGSAEPAQGRRGRDERRRRPTSTTRPEPDEAFRRPGAALLRSESCPNAADSRS